VAGLQIVSVNVSEPGVLLRRPGGDVISSLDKRPAGAGMLALGRLGLDGDRPADTRPAPGGDMPVHLKIATGWLRGARMLAEGRALSGSSPGSSPGRRPADGHWGAGCRGCGVYVRAQARRVCGAYRGSMRTPVKRAGRSVAMWLAVSLAAVGGLLLVASVLVAFLVADHSSSDSSASSVIAIGLGGLGFLVFVLSGALLGSVALARLWRRVRRPAR
jgi:hypothetical protein